MADQEIQQNIIGTDYKLADAFNVLKTDILMNLNCHAIATIQSFNPAKQTVQATINYVRTYFRQEQGNYVPYYKKYPVLMDVPVVILKSQGFCLTMGDPTGEECLILFNDRDMNNWFSGGSGSPVASPRLHSLSDGIALVGLGSLANSVVNYDTTRAVLRTKDGLAGVGVGAELIKVFNATTTLGTILTQLMTDLQTVATALGGNPSIETAAAAGGAALATAATSLQTLITGLLE